MAQIMQRKVDAGTVNSLPVRWTMATTRTLEGDVEIRQIVRYLGDGVMPEDLKVRKYVMMEKERFVVLDGILYSARRD